MGKKNLLKTEFSKWIAKYGGHDYYVIQLESTIEKFNVKYDGIYANIFYKQYFIMRLAMDDRSLKLIRETGTKSSESNPIIQKKLYHEYKEYFSLYNEEFKITQLNIYFVHKYIAKVCSKIDSGFERYTELLEKQGLSDNNSGFLKIEINNAFSVAELNELIQSYNNLYSIIYCMCESGYEETLTKEEYEVINAHTMILESIKIGSLGFLASVGSGLVVELVKALVIAALTNDKKQYEERKTELENRAMNDPDFADDKTFELIQRLEYLIEQREKGKIPAAYVEQAIFKTMKRIEELQGTTHVDLLA